MKQKPIIMRPAAAPITNGLKSIGYTGLIFMCGAMFGQIVIYCGLQNVMLSKAGVAAQAVAFSTSAQAAESHEAKPGDTGTHTIAVTLPDLPATTEAAAAKALKPAQPPRATSSQILKDPRSK